MNTYMHMQKNIYGHTPTNLCGFDNNLLIHERTILGKIYETKGR